MIPATQIEAAALKFRELTIAISFVDMGPAAVVERTLDILAESGIILGDVKGNLTAALEELNRKEETLELERFLG